MRFGTNSKNEQVWFIFGAGLVVLGIVLLFNIYAAWWVALLSWIRSFSRFVVPLALIALGAYVLWASRNQKLGSVLGAGGLNAQEPVLHRLETDARVAGVCGGIAHYFGIDSMIVRIIAVLLGFASPLLTLVMYAILAAVLKKS